MIRYMNKIKQNYYTVIYKFRGELKREDNVPTLEMRSDGRKLRLISVGRVVLTNTMKKIMQAT